MARGKRLSRDVAAQPDDLDRTAGGKRPHRKSQFTRSNALIIFGFFSSLFVIVYLLYYLMVIWIPAWFPPARAGPVRLPVLHLCGRGWNRGRRTDQSRHTGR